MMTFKICNHGDFSNRRIQSHPFPFDEDRLIDNDEQDSHEGDDDFNNNDDNACCRAL